MRSLSETLKPLMHRAFELQEFSAVSSSGITGVTVPGLRKILEEDRRLLGFVPLWVEGQEACSPCRLSSPVLCQWVHGS